MNLFLEWHQELLGNLLSNKVDFIIIGGYSVNYYGSKRATGDLDIWLKPDYKNKERLVSALQSLELDDYNIDTILDLDFTKHVVFTIWDEPEKVDYLTFI